MSEPIHPPKEKISPIDTMRHSCAHVLAAAIQDRFPDARFGIGPVVENGFYYDVETDIPISEDDLKQLTKKMRKLIGQNHSFERAEINIDDARARFDKIDQKYKVEIIDDLKKEGETTVSLYKSGPFTDLCRGPHIDSTGEINAKAFMLTKVAGAYWRGDENREQLQRIYGVAFEKPEDLIAYKKQLLEAAKRDHRKLGKELDLFTFSELVGPGLPLWTPKGTLLRTLVDDYVWTLRKEKGYEKVAIPHITKKALYEKSGHWDKFSDELFVVQSREDKEYALKPMNCPHHTQIFDAKMRSWRDMPQRYAETTMVYRDEQSGELGGLTRVLSITQDDAHVFCRENQIKEEFFAIWDIIDTFYTTFGFEFKKISLSFHDPKTMEKYLGTEEIWKKAESILEEIAKERGVDASIDIGEAALYGPKVDFIATDSLGREHQVATIQLDLNLPKQFDLTCINEKGEKEQVVMIHAAITGSIERFLAVIIEHYAGAFPLWLSPVQAVIIPISDKFNDYGEKVRKELTDAGLRVEIDTDSETLGKRIREAQKQKVPYMLVVGEKEVDAGTVAVRTRAGEDEGAIDLTTFTERLVKEVEEKK